VSEEDVDPAALRRELRSRLGQLGVSLQILAEDVLGEDDQRVDWVAVEPNGRAWVALVDASGEDDGLVARGLAQRAWVQARLPDWTQLAPGLVARADECPHLLLIAPDFSRVTRVAAREAGGEGIRLARYRWRVGRRGAELVLRPLEPLPSLAPTGGDAPPARIASVFRSVLTDRDFDGGDGERSR
jgi:hypothetical protein